MMSPNQPVILVLPDNGRSDYVDVTIDRSTGLQVGTLRVYGSVRDDDGSMIPNHTGVLAENELPDDGSRYFYRGRFFGTPRERTPSLPANRM